MKNLMLLNLLSSLALLFVLTACTQGLGSQNQDLGQKIADSVGCQEFRSQTFDAYYNYFNQTKTRPDVELVKQSMLSSLSRRLRRSGLQIESQIQLLNEVVQNLDHSLDSVDSHSQLAMLQRLIKLETGSRETVELAKLGQELEQNLRKLKSSNMFAQADCVQVPVLPPPNNSQSGLPLLTQGARRTFATAYQTCDSLTLPAVTAAVQDLEGVEKDGSPDGIGYGRKYTNIPLLQKTHYYVQGVTYSKGCISVKDRPLVYDYGGEAYWDGKNSLNLFVDAGEGGPALGIDCSAFVSTAIAHAGLRYQPGLANKPIYSRRNSSDFLNPEDNGLSCFPRIAVNSMQSILPGDILAVHGHVLLVDRIGSDPFALKKVSSIDGCDSLNYKNFDFTVMQSSSGKNGIGLNRYIARDYLAESGEVQDAFLKYAHAACLSHFDGKSRILKESDATITRHLGTAECLAGTVDLVGQQCVQDCSIEN